MKRLEKKVAIVTGAASGLGRSIALLFTKEGARVIAADVNEIALQKLKKEVSNAGGELSMLVTDITKPADIEDLISTTVTNYGTIDVLVNNAGIMDDFSPTGDLKDEMWARVMEINLNGPMRLMRSALKVMLENKSGSIINISSVGGLQGARAGAAYTASKHGLIGLTKNTGYMYSKSGIRCNAIAPGAMETNIGSTIDFNHLNPLASSMIMPGMVINPRTSNPMEVANVALFLASNEASFMNGAVVVADGGWTAF
jgi:NAD(P)-dependent dehydrogenase (short-subunit alcohol dehydrogenase family)